MTNSELMSIGAFAQQSGLTASALRFYADSQVLVPAEVDASSGYRFYDPGQLDRAVLLRRLREIGMPLAGVESVLRADPGEAQRLVEEHVRKVVGDAATAQQQAAVITASLDSEPRTTVAVLSGPVLAAAIEQVLTATTREPGLAVLNGVRVVVGPEAVTLVATDRYRLATRTLATLEPAATTWEATVDADDLRGCLPQLRRSPRAVLAAGRQELRLILAGRDDIPCRLLAEPFPDYRAMLDALPEVTTRVVIAKTSLLRALEENPVGVIALGARPGEIAIDGVTVPASVNGPDADVSFEMATLYPGVASAIGADLLLDLRGSALPATIRSADHGDLTTLAMPTAAT
ncbi:MerR family transcriptional regulator [Tomitella biformata]|uniref:DNA polymerase III subunit beta family protein n=1 Tax=Tomitella biformata TaxID=630403 RepID=UPI000464C90D|nr:MerR family transcriptional regulator [Tomitella biformata]